MKVRFCDGYYQEGELFFHHDDETGYDVQVSEDEAMAHKPSMLLDEDGNMRWMSSLHNWNNAPWYEHNHETNKKDSLEDDRDIPEELHDLTMRYNQYAGYLDVLEELLEEAKVDSNTLAEIKLIAIIQSFKAEQAELMRRMGIIF